MTSVSEQLRRLLEALYLKTVEGKVAWEFHSDLDMCQTNLGKGYVEVLGDTNEDGDYFNYVRILNEDMTVVDNIYGGGFGAGKVPVNTSHRNYWELINDLKAAAKRSALGTQDIVLSMISSLGADDLDMNSIPF